MKIKNSIAAGEFKSKFLQLMDDVQAKRVPLIITKRGVPIVKLVPYEAESKPIFGCMKDTISIEADIISPIDEIWDVNDE